MSKNGNVKMSSRRLQLFAYQRFRMEDFFDAADDLLDSMTKPKVSVNITPIKKRHLNEEELDKQPNPEKKQKYFLV